MRRRERIRLNWWYFAHVLWPDAAGMAALTSIIAGVTGLVAAALILGDTSIPWEWDVLIGAWLFGSIGVLLWDARS